METRLQRRTVPVLRAACVLAAGVLLFNLAALGAGAPRKRRRQPAMELTSPAFKHNQAIPRKYTCEGENISPPLSWSGLPPGTASLALIMDDPDAPAGTWVHWVVYDLPAALKGLEEGTPRTELLTHGGKQGLAYGVEEFSRLGYGGPCPPPGKPHRYFFKLYALDRELGLAPRSSKPELLKAMKGRVLGQSELVGVYRR